MVSRAIRIGLVCSVVLVLAMVLTAPRIRAPRDTGVIKALTTIHTAQVQFFSRFNRYAASMQELGPPQSGADGPSAAGLIERDLASGEKSGYKYTLTATPTGYTIRAEPTRYGVTGSKTYFSGSDMRIHVHSGPEPATENDPAMGGPAIFADPPVRHRTPPQS